MDVRTCRSCGRMFNYITGPSVCPGCADKLEKKFQEVKVYVRENPHASLQEIADDNEVSVKQLKQWVREERLSFTDDSPVGLECESCGTMIKTGRYCNACKGRLNAGLQSVTNKKPEKPVEKKTFKDNKNKMRYLQ